MIHVAFAADAGFWPFVPTMLHSLATHTPGPIRIHAFVRGVPTAEADLAAIPDGRVSAAVYRLDGQAWPDGLRPELLATGFYDRLRYSSAIPPSETDRVIALDVDVVVRRDLRELWEAETGPCGIAARPYYLWHVHEQALFWQADPAALDDLPDFTAFNAGVMLLDLATLRAGGCEAATLAVAARYRLPDETALAVYSAGRFARLDPSWNVLRIEDDRNPTPPCVYHWIGGPKPWQGGARFGEVWHHYRRGDWRDVCRP